MLQGLSGVGPSLAQRLLIKFGSLERVMTGDEQSLTQVSGCAARKLGQYAAREVGHLKDVHSTRL